MKEIAVVEVTGDNIGCVRKGEGGGEDGRVWCEKSAARWTVSADSLLPSRSFNHREHDSGSRIRS